MVRVRVRVSVSVRVRVRVRVRARSGGSGLGLGVVVTNHDTFDGPKDVNLTKWHKDPHNPIYINNKGHSVSRGIYIL